MTVGRFLVLCPPKAIELGPSSRPGRPDSRDRVRSELEALDFGGREKMVICLPGGGLAAEGTGCCPEVACAGHLLAVLSGAIQNYAYLVRKYVVEELGLPRNVSLEDLRQTTPIRDAALLCRLYELLGTSMVAKLRGKFAFCLYDSKTVRVLAARDASGAVSLIHGTTADGDLFVASGDVRPPAVDWIAEIGAGEYKYGWRAAPRRFANPSDVVEGRAAVASNAAMAALSGIVVKEQRGKGGDDAGSPKGSSECSSKGGNRVRESRSGWIGGESRSSSRSEASLAIPKFRTKAEMREWSAGAAREAIESYEAAGGSIGWDARAWAGSPGWPADGRWRSPGPATGDWRTTPSMGSRMGSSGNMSDESCGTALGSGGRSPMRSSPDSWGESGWGGRAGAWWGRWEATGPAGHGANAATWRK
eukprot:evm.model.scf_3071.2 EVM.evm.TU.scf_3071.2   scf_3071:13670-15585(-)